MSSLEVHHRLALTGAVLTSGIALTDAVTAATTGHFSVFADDSSNTPAFIAGVLVHGLTYAALAYVLVRESQRFDDFGRLVRVARAVLVASLLALALGFVLVSPALRLTVGTGQQPMLWGIVASGAFFAMILSTLVVALAVLRRNPLGVGGGILRLLLPVAAATVVLGVVGSPWAHPAYVESVINLGLALVGAGVAVVVARPEVAATPVSPA